MESQIPGPEGDDGSLPGAQHAAGAAHSVQFLGLEFPARSIAEFLGEPLRAEGGAIVVARPEHSAAIRRELGSVGVDLAAVDGRRLLFLDATDTLAQFMVAARPESTLFERSVGATLEELSKRCAPVRAYGEMVDVLWRRDEANAALELEDLWNGLLARVPAQLLCGYALECFDGDAGTVGFDRVCSLHENVAPGEAELSRRDPGRLQAELLLGKRHVRVATERRLETEASEREARVQLSAAHERLRLLQDVTSALSEAATVEEIGRVVATGVARAARADRTLLLVPTSEGTLRAVVHAGLDDESWAEYSSLSIDSSNCRSGAQLPRDRLETLRVDSALPAAEAFRTCSPRWVDSGGPPRDRHEIAPNGVPGAVGCLPVAVGGPCLGVVVFGFLADRELTAIDRAFMQDLARQVGTALDRARLYERARRSEARLLQANGRKDAFLALLGHELRNPLAPIMTALQIMKLRGDGDGKPERAIIERQVRHVSSLVDDLLDVSRITQGKIELNRARVEVSAVLTQAVEMASPLVEKRGQRLSVEVPAPPVWIEVDARRVAQAIANLLTNAAKYTDCGGWIALRAVRVGADVVVSVADNGVGIRPEMLSAIFEPFVQLERTVEGAQGGLGLGLALVKSLIDLHGGSVSAASPGPGCGTEFAVRLPALPADLPAASQAAADRLRRVEPSAIRRVLIVDDNRDAVDALALMLGFLGHDVAVAYDGVHALETVRARGFDVVLLDINLPVMDGYEVAAQLRDLPQAGRMRFVALTGYGTDEDRGRSAASGFDAHLVKPIDHDRLMGLIAHAPVNTER